MEDDVLDELEDNFNRAAEVVQKASASDTGKKMSQEIMLQIYGLYKAATIGKCTEPKPGIFDPRGRAKWTAWTNASKLSKEAAMADYVKLIIEKYDWDIEKTEQFRGNSSSFGGNAVSSFAVPQDEDSSDPEPLIFQWVKQDNLEMVADWLNQDHDIRLQDSDGLTLLHWAVDRGHLDMTTLLLDSGADPTILDNEEQSALDYAITCEHNSIITLLQSRLRPST